MSESGTHPLRVYVDGQPDRSVPWSDRGLAYGEGVFETCRLVGGRLPLWSLHRHRLSDSAHALGLPVDISWLEGHLPEAIGPTQFGTVKIMLTGGSGGRGYARPDRPGRCIVAVLPDTRTELQQDWPPARVVLCHTPVSENARLAGHKHMNRLDNVLARAEWRGSAFDEGLVADSRRELIEATAHNLFVKTASGWVTPSLTQSGVRGVMRQLIIDELAPSLGLAVQEAPVTLKALCNAEEAFICNSNRGIRALGELCEPDGTQLARWHSFAQTSVLGEALRTYLGQTTGEAP